MIQAKDNTGAPYTADDAYRQGRMALFEPGPGNHVGITGSWFDEDFPEWDGFWNGVLDKLPRYDHKPTTTDCCHSRYSLEFEGTML